MDIIDELFSIISILINDCLINFMNGKGKSLNVFIMIIIIAVINDKNLVYFQPCIIQYRVIKINERTRPVDPENGQY